MLCYGVLFCVVLFCVVLCYVVLSCIVWCYCKSSDTNMRNERFKNYLLPYQEYQIKKTGERQHYIKK